MGTLTSFDWALCVRCAGAVQKRPESLGAGALCPRRTHAVCTPPPPRSSAEACLS